MGYFVHLSKDRKFKKLVIAQKTVRLKKRKKLHIYLCASIMSQQLSTKVADVIYKRFLNLFGGVEPTVEAILGMPFELLRGIGLSNAKAAYVHNVARFALERGIEFEQLDQMSNEEVTAYLTQIKGVGRWTTEMLLMFALGRKDVFAVDDLGIQHAMIKLYELDARDKKKLKEELLRISGKWSPYRTYACVHLWQWKDNAPLRKKATKS